MDMELLNLWSTGKVHRTVPLGLLQLAAVLEAAGFRVGLRDYQLEAVSATEPFGVDALLAFFEASESQVLGVSCLDNLLPAVVLAVQRLKRRHPDRVVVLGGPGPSAVAERLVGRFEDLDYVVRGEGELALVGLLRALRSDGRRLAEVPGLVWRAGGEVRTNGSGPPVDLDGLPPPAYHLVDVRRYERVSLVSSRGCPYKCAYCSIPGALGAYRRSSAAAFYRTFRFLRVDLGLTQLHVDDDTFLVDKRRVLDFCNRIVRDRLEVSWTCFNRADLADEETYCAMQEAGCFRMYCGVESGSERVLRRIGKPYTVDQILRTLELTDRFFELTCSFMWGYPFETLADFWDTVMLMADIAKTCRRVTELQLFMLAPLAHSALYREFADGVSLSETYRSTFAWSHAHEPEIVELVAQHPELFPAFRHYDQPDLEAKWAALTQLNALPVSLG